MKTFLKIVFLYFVVTLMGINACIGQELLYSANKEVCGVVYVVKNTTITTNLKAVAIVIPKSKVISIKHHVLKAKTKLSLDNTSKAIKKNLINKFLLFASIPARHVMVQWSFRIGTIPNNVYKSSFIKIKPTFTLLTTIVVMAFILSRKKINSIIYYLIFCKLNSLINSFFARPPPTVMNF
ncbi:hypothetical protein [Flavobacterium branchiophilum]|uniref:Hypothetical transmembrane protein n=1 Tax=Flavobacterium branchiophilum (strain FL-15) TaxID=1034807 RepID=G2Z7A9_FLABF|nr:hypothetical protein [Flavobacterium branchiophilum]CCB69014.1 Hypothetical transmembrane protein [Flavobacterium branchiophilum FL-15]